MEELCARITPGHKKNLCDCIKIIIIILRCWGPLSGFHCGWETAQALASLQNGGEGMCAIGRLGVGYHTARRDFPSGAPENGNRIGLEGK